MSVFFVAPSRFSSVVRGDQAPPTSSQLHTPTQPISSTHTPDTASPNITSNQPSDTVTSDQPSSSSSSSDILLSTVAIGNDTNVMTTKIESSLSTKDIDNIVSDTYNVTVSEATRSAASATAEESEVKIEGAAVETVSEYDSIISVHVCSFVVLLCVFIEQLINS